MGGVEQGGAGEMEWLGWRHASLSSHSLAGDACLPGLSSSLLAVLEAVEAELPALPDKRWPRLACACL